MQNAAGICLRRQSINKLHNRLRGCMKGPQPLHMQIRSGDMCGARSGCKPLPISFSGRARSTQENDVFRFPFPLQGCVSRLAATARRQHFVDGLRLPPAGSLFALRAEVDRKQSDWARQCRAAAKICGKIVRQANFPLREANISAIIIPLFSLEPCAGVYQVSSFRPAHPGLTPFLTPRASE